MRSRSCAIWRVPSCSTSAIETGKAQTLKLLNNLLSATGMAASCEAFILGAKAGLDPQTMLEIINSGDASSSATRNKFPQSILPRRFDYGARMAITAKDISLTVGEAEELGVPMWIARSVQQVWTYAVSQGGADRDGTALITYLEPWAGVEVRSRPQAAPVRPTDATPRKEFGALVVVCEPQTLPLLARRLRAQSWDVALAERGRHPAGAEVGSSSSGWPESRGPAVQACGGCGRQYRNGGAQGSTAAERRDADDRQYLSALLGGFC